MKNERKNSQLESTPIYLNSTKRDEKRMREMQFIFQNLLVHNSKIARELH